MQRPGLAVLFLLPAQLPERNGAGGGDIQRIHAVGHGDLDRVVAGSDGVGGEAVALGAKHDGKLRLFRKLLVVDAHRAVAEGHRGGLEAEGVEDVHPLLRPVCRGLAQLPPGYLEHRTHADADGAAAERVAAGS